jgi:hypothetical protein
VLDPSKEWTRDDQTAGVHKTAPIETVRNKKTPKVITKAPATDKHQADTELYWMDERAGLWTKVERSGALAPERYAAILGRVDTLMAAVKVALEEANRVPAPDKSMGNELFTYVLTGR